MRQIIKQREIVADDWRHPGEEGDGPQLLTLAALQAAVQAGTAPAGGIGVQLEPGDDVEQLAPLLSAVSLVVVNFPKNGEGRGFSQAQLLRQRYRFRGELRASGNIKRDYLFFLARCGFDAFELDPAENLRASLDYFGTFSVAYQTGSDRDVRVRMRPG